jgi:hypothetical protein
MLRPFAYDCATVYLYGSEVDADVGQQSHPGR